MILVKLADFIGQYNIPDAKGVYTAPNVQSYIDTYEKQYLDQLLGVDLSNKIIAYLATGRTPINANYDYIIDPFQFQTPAGGCCGNEIMDSKGIKAFLVAAIFYKYVSVSLVDSQTGVMNPQAETAAPITPYQTMRFAENKWNEILDTPDSIQWYLWNNQSISDYSTFAGRRFHVKLADIL